VADGVVEAAPERAAAHRGRGRPARSYTLTREGRDAFHQAYDDLAAGALRFLAETAGEEAVAAFARSRVAEVERRYRPVVEAVDLADRPRVLADALSADGYAASARSARGAGTAGEQLCQHHCPVAHVAEQFPQLCEAETEAFARLLGTHVQRLATIAHGDGVCTTFVPRTTASTTSTTSTTRTGTAVRSHPERTA
ncbi:MAG: transcriptional regulator, partial [Actinomycetota bacterium]|nr:transcriptional regulator [Actinomycetota bacterium]